MERNKFIEYGWEDLRTYEQVVCICEVVSHSAISTKTPLARARFTNCNLRLWCFLPPTGADTELALRQLALFRGAFGGSNW